MSKIESALVISATSPTDEDGRLLRLLSAVEGDSQITQRSISKDLGIALGLANAYLKRCVKTGLIKVAQAPANRYAYYLTPRGFAEKSRLTAEFFRQSFNLVRAAREEYRALFGHCARHGWTTLLLCGTGDAGEIATLSAAECQVRLVGFFDPSATIDSLVGLPVHHGIDRLPPADAAIVTDLRDPRAMTDLLGPLFAAERILVPRFLGGPHLPGDGP